MKFVVMLSAVALLAATLVAGQAKTGANAKSRADEDEARLAAALAGRTAGPPQDCLREADLGSQEAYGNRAILFTSRDDVVYVNRPPSVCPGLAYGGGIKVKTPMSRLCRGDIITVFDPISKMEIGGCALGPFTPYKRTATTK